MTKTLDVSDGSRNRIIYEKDMIYVFISCESKEIFISSINDRIPNVAAIYDSLTRIISMAWQTNDTEDIVIQLSRSSRSELDLPGMLADLFIQKQDSKS